MDSCGRKELLINLKLKKLYDFTLYFDLYFYEFNVNLKSWFNDIYKLKLINICIKLSDFNIKIINGSFFMKK